jgi:hypothetical protein
LQDVCCTLDGCNKRRVKLCYRHLPAIWAELRVAAACVVSLLLQGCLHAAAVVAALLLCLRAGACLIQARRNAASWIQRARLWTTACIIAAGS